MYFPISFIPSHFYSSFNIFKYSYFSYVFQIFFFLSFKSIYSSVHLFTDSSIHLFIHSFLSFFCPSLFGRLTMEVILSIAFGLDNDYQLKGDHKLTNAAKGFFVINPIVFLVGEFSFPIQSRVNYI